MKKTIKYFVLVLFSFAIASALFFVHPKNSAKAFSGQDYATKNYELAAANSSDGISIQIVPQSSTNFVSYVKVNVTDWSNIQTFKLKRIVLNVVKSIENDDASAVCSFASHAEVPTESSTFLFNQNGYYVIEYSIGENAESATQKAIYLSTEFTRQISLSAVDFSDSTKYLNQEFESDVANIVAASNGSTTISINADENCQAIYTFEYDHNSILTNSVQSIKLKSGSTLLSECEFEVFCTLPSFKFLTEDESEATSVLSGLSSEDLNGATTDGVIFFNQEVTPALDFTGFSQAQIDLFNKRFKLQHNTATIGPLTKKAEITFKNNSTNILASQKYRTNTNPSENLQLRLGSPTATQAYPNLTTALKMLYAPTDLYPVSNSNAIAVEYKRTPTTLTIWSYLKGDISKPIIFAYKFNFIKYSQSDSEITCIEPTSTNPNKITLSRQNGVQIPIDIIIINQNTNERFAYEDVFKNEESNSLNITIKNSGKYRFVAAYRDSTLADDTNSWNHVSFVFEFAANGNLTLSTSNGQIVSGQTTNKSVTVNSHNNYTVVYNAKYETTYNSPQTFTDEGYYQITTSIASYNFTIISTSAKNSYTATSYGNATLKSITENNKLQSYVEPVYLTKTGSYTLNYSLSSVLPITIEENDVNLQTTTEFSYVVNISNPTFSINANVKNGQKTSDNVVINSITANGNYTVTITHNKKSTTYTKEQFNALSQKARTFSKTGTYKILITDESGNQGIFTFEKYYQMNFVLILLIGIFITLAAIGLIVIIRLRLKSKVK